MTYALHHGDRLVLGYYNVLRVVHPHEADVLRQRAEGVLDEESSDLSDLSDNEATAPWENLPLGNVWDVFHGI